MPPFFAGGCDHSAVMCKLAEVFSLLLLVSVSEAMSVRFHAAQLWHHIHMDINQIMYSEPQLPEA